MNFLRSVLVSLTLATSALADDPGVLLAAGGDESGFKPLVDILAAKGPLQASFAEHRYFPFRHQPTTVHGVLRISPDRGLSLQYTEPVPSVMIADPSGLLLRDKNGRDRSVPPNSREAGAIASLLPIMRFDLPALLPRFAIRARRDGPGWRFDFSPRDADVAHTLGTISVSGIGTDVTHIGFRRSASQHIEIEVGDTRSGVAFTPDELTRYFR